MWRRGVAFLIDLAPLAVLAIAENAAGIPQNAVVGLLNLLLLLSYYAGMNYRYGGTLGKLVVGLRVVLPSSPNVLPQLLIRAVIKILCLIPPAGMLSGLMAIWDQEGRSLPDLGADTRVVDAATLRPPAPLSFFERLLASGLVFVGPWVVLAVLSVCFFGLMVIALFARMLVELIVLVTIGEMLRGL